MRDLIALPGRVARFCWGFVNPTRTAGRVPLGRFTIVTALLAALIFIGYTMTKKSLPLPWSADGYEIEVVFPDARGLDRVDDPGAAVAGTPFGRVTDVVYESGRAVATLTLSGDVRGKVFNDATATIRPGSAIQNLVVNVDPGTPEAGELGDGERIEAASTDTFIPIDDLTSVLDADTRAYAQIVVTEAERALVGRENELREGLDELGTLTETAVPVTRALRTRRALLTRLVGNLEVVAQTLGDRQVQLAETIDTGARTLEVTAAHELDVAELTRRLGPTLVAAEGALRAVNRLTVPLLVALDELGPSAPLLASGFAATRELIPRTAALTETFEGLIRDGSHPLDLLVEGTVGLRRRLAANVPIAGDLTALARRLNRYKGGLAQLADTLSGALSVNDNGGTYGQVDVLEIEQMKPENFGLPARAARSSGGDPSQLETLLARALEQACLDGSGAACALRLRSPELPPVDGAREEGP
ncbi:MAG: MlaD family protein [Solirubrobacterales bacterium]